MIYFSAVLGYNYRFKKYGITVYYCCSTGIYIPVLMYRYCAVQYSIVLVSCSRV